MLKFEHSEYVEPSATDVKKALKIARLSAARGGKLLGRSERSMFGYRLGEFPMPYSCWRLLLVYARLVSKPDRVPIDDHRSAA